MIFLRHPKPRIAPGTCYGRLDIPLTETAAAEIASAIKRLPRVTRLITSPAQRCRRLADGIARFHGLDPTIDPRLAELDFGAWEGRPWTRIPRSESDPWAADPWTIAPPGGERFADLHARVTDALTDAPPEATIITHAGVIRAARMILQQASFAQVFAAKIPYATPIPLNRKAA